VQFVLQQVNSFLQNCLQWKASMTWQLSGMSKNPLHWLVQKNQNFFEDILLDFSAGTRRATFCFLNSPEYFWLESECFVSTCHLKLYSFGMLRLSYISHIWCYLYSQQNYFCVRYSWNVVFLNSVSLLYFCQLCYLGSEWFHIKHTLLIITTS